MKRSERVLFALLEAPEPGEKPLSEEDRRLVEQLFLVGGASFTSLKDTLEESRRIEMKLEFLDTGETRGGTRPVELPRAASGKERRE
jgi:hypothetical protein